MSIDVMEVDIMTNELKEKRSTAECSWRLFVRMLTSVIE
jgi:hypothetical protein